jgi:hypothetical protein
LQIPSIALCYHAYCMTCDSIIPVGWTKNAMFATMVD